MKGAPDFDHLLLILPTFGYPLSFALGLSLGCAAVLLAMLAGLLLARTLPLAALSFILANATPLYKPFVRQARRKCFCLRLRSNVGGIKVY